MTMAETARMEFAYQIQRFTHVNHMTAEMFAMECGVQKKTVDSALEEKPVSSRAMQKICSYVGITLDSLWQPPISENFLKLEEIMLDTVQPGVLPSIQLAAKNVVDALEGMPPYEQKRNLRWLRQIVEHSEMYIPKKPPSRKRRRSTLKGIFRRYPLASSLCFTRKISPKQKARLEKLIEDSKKK